MLDALFSIFTGGATGGILGAIGAYFTKIEERKTLVIKNEHEKTMGMQGLEELGMEQTHQLNIADKQIDLAETEGELLVDLKETEGWLETLKSQSVKSGIKWVDAVRSLMRPIITAYLLTVTTYLAYNISELMGGLDSLPSDELLKLYTMIITQTFFLTNMVVSWWFGSRKTK